MAHKPWSKAEIDFLWERYRTASLEEILDALPDRTWGAIKQKASHMGVTQKGHRPKYITQWGKDVSERIKSDVDITRLKNEVKYYRKLYQQAIKRRGVQDLIVETIGEVASLVPPVEIQTVIPREQAIKLDVGTETDVLQISDLHGGEEVDSEETMGLAAFDMDILSKRLRKLFTITLGLVELRRSMLQIPELVIAMEGDMVSGEIHEELVRTNVEHMMTISARVAFMLAQGIGYLAPHFERIRVECVPGNHARLRKRVYYKEKYVNWDYMCYQWMAVFCRGMENVVFHIPKSPFILVNAENTRLLLTHGDSVRSWMGIPWYGIDRYAKRLTRLLQAKGDYYDALLVGHFHNRADIDTEIGPIIVNGSVKGGDEYSIGVLQTVNRPSQNLLHFHSEHGYIGGEPIFVQEEEGDEGFEDFLPEVWADLMDEMGGV